MFWSVPPATRAIILINVGVYVVQLLVAQPMEMLFALWPLGDPLFRPWQLLSYAFLHDPQNLAHIFFNMFALFMFGGALEQHLGARRLVLYYLICALTAAATQLAVEQAAGVGGPVIGASGAIFGILLAFAWYFPRARVGVFLVIPMPAWLFVTIYGLVELFFGVTGREPGVAHFAHLGGLLGGALCILYWRIRHRFARR
ncbi:MAG TPA: rhomboid family intramembrane serine protease [Steroidobacteraceae bacterium]|jgi:membrane associated rhomboid family serine protease|nr:rhomboid family intramembrane serine protease [Steroidobacteraceae bacterium]